MSLRVLMAVAPVAKPRKIADATSLTAGQSNIAIRRPAGFLNSAENRLTEIRAEYLRQVSAECIRRHSSGPPQKKARLEASTSGDAHGRRLGSRVFRPLSRVAQTLADAAGPVRGEETRGRRTERQRRARNQARRWRRFRLTQEAAAESEPGSIPGPSGTRRSWAGWSRNSLRCPPDSGRAMSRRSVSHLDFAGDVGRVMDGIGKSLTICVRRAQL